tara:strand:+ start:371 stop:574 length:204 start_codon:yes stop_codon:yes gene_type:complete
MNLFAQAQLDLVDAWNMSWEEGIQFIIVLVALYYVKKRMDLYFTKKTARTTIYKVKLVGDQEATKNA